MTNITISEKYIKRAGGFWAGRNWKKELETFLSKDEIECYVYERFVDGGDELTRIFTVKDVSKELFQQGLCARVTTATFEVRLAYSGLRDKESAGLDMVVEGRFKIADARAFLKDYGIERLKSTEIITSTALETFLADRCKAAIIDEVVRQTYDHLKNRDALPVQWWQSNLPKWLKLPWLELVEVSAVGYESETADRAAELEKRQELIELEAAEQTQQQEYELWLKKQQEAFDSAVRDIEANRRITEAEQQLQIEELKHKLQQQQLQAKEEVEVAHLEAEKKKAELEAEIARIKNDAELAEETLRRAEEAEVRNKEMVEEIQRAQKELCESIDLLKPAVEAVQAGQAGMLRLNAERLNASASGMSATTMELLGMTGGPTYLAQLFREKAKSDHDTVMMRKVELSSRDIGTRKVDALKINSSLQFEFIANRGGYATVLNVGTSGKVWLQTPNAYVGIDHSKVKAGTSCTIPGPELLPSDQLARQGLGYIEVGPPGWEELIVILTEQPIITAQDIFLSQASNPFVELSPKRIGLLMDQLADLSPDSWACGVLSFLVEN